MEISLFMNIDKNTWIIIVVIALGVGYYFGTTGGFKTLDMERIIELDQKCVEYGKLSESPFGSQGIYLLKYRYGLSLDTCIKEERRLWWDSSDVRWELTDLYSNTMIIEYDDRCEERTDKTKKCYSKEEYEKKLDEILKR